MKTLGDYTVREIAQCCENSGTCSKCQLLQGGRCSMENLPQNWNVKLPLEVLCTLSEIDAVRFLRECANVEKIIRNPDGLFAETKDGSRIELRWETFLSIKVGDTLEVYNL